MFFRVHLHINFTDHSVRVYQEGVTGGHRWSILCDDLRAIIAGRAVHVNHSMSWIEKQLKCQCFLRTKFLMGVYAVDAYTNDCRPVLLILSQVALEIMRFNRTTGGHVLRIE